MQPPVLNFHSSHAHRATKISKNHYNMINASKGNSLNVHRYSRNKQTNVTMKQTLHSKLLENVRNYGLKSPFLICTGFHPQSHLSHLRCTALKCNCIALCISLWVALHITLYTNILRCSGSSFLQLINCLINQGW